MLKGTVWAYNSILISVELPRPTMDISEGLFQPSAPCGVAQVLAVPEPRSSIQPCLPHQPWLGFPWLHTHKFSEGEPLPQSVSWRTEPMEMERREQKRGETKGCKGTGRGESQESSLWTVTGSGCPKRPYRRAPSRLLPGKVSVVRKYDPNRKRRAGYVSWRAPLVSLPS